MKIILALLTFALLLTGNTVMAQRQGKGRNMPGRHYNPETVTNITGTIESVEKQTYGKRNGYTGIHLLVQTKTEKIAVHLGPEWYIEEQGVTLDKGDKVNVEGSRITFDGEPAIVARKLIKGSQALILRSEDGTPKWAGQRQR